MFNQTRPVWLLNASPKGTGVYVLFTSGIGMFGPTNWSVSYDDSAYGAIMKVLVADIGYLDCVKRGIQNKVIALKWVPHSIAFYDDVVKSASSCANQGIKCVDECAGFGCECIGGECK